MTLATRTIKTLAFDETEATIITPEIEEIISREDTFPRILLNNVRKFGKRTALREKVRGLWKEISWIEYLANVKSFALGLKSFGFDRKNTLAILGDNCPEWLYAELASECLGGYSVGVYPTNPWPEVEYILANSNARHAVVSDQEQLDKVLECKDRLPGLEKIIIIDIKGVRQRYTDPAIISFRQIQRQGITFEKEHPGLFIEEMLKAEPDDVCTIIYTSGTTGPPKGAMLSHNNLLYFTEKWLKVIPMYETDEVVAYLPLSHIMERDFSLIFPLKVGYVVSFAESIDAVQSNLTEIAPTIFVGVPRIWEKMYSSHMVKMQESTWIRRMLYTLGMVVAERHIEAGVNGKTGFFLNWAWQLFYWIVYHHLLDQLGLRKTRFAMSGAAPIAPEILKFFNSMGLKIREAYGQTESSSAISIHQGDDIKFGTVGIPYQPIKIAEDGEILVGGPSVFKGYFNNPDATSETIVDGWLHTGDVGYVGSEDGHLYITDRKKDIIITSGGKNISPQEIENRLKVSPYIKEAIVFGDRRKFLSSLIQIDEENVGIWAQKNSIPYTTFKDLSQNKKTHELIQQEVSDANKRFSSVETIKKFRLLDKELDQDDEELTATQKVRRKKIEKTYKELIDSMY